MALGYTTNYQIPYLLESTPLVDLDVVTQEMADKLDAALVRNGVPLPTELGHARGTVGEFLRTTPLSRPSHSSGTPSPTGEVNTVLEGVVPVYAGRWYRLLLTCPQLGGAATDRVSLRLAAGPDGGALTEVQASYQGLTANGGPVTLRTKRLQLPAGPVRIRAQAIRDVGTAAWSMYADSVSTIVLSLDDDGKV